MLFEEINLDFLMFGVFTNYLLEILAYSLQWLLNEVSVFMQESQLLIW